MSGYLIVGSLSEVECQAYLKQVIDNEDYDMAEKIRKQMEKFR